MHCLRHKHGTASANVHHKIIQELKGKACKHEPAKDNTAVNCVCTLLDSMLLGRPFPALLAGAQGW